MKYFIQPAWTILTLLSLLVAYACGDGNERRLKESRKIQIELSPEHRRAPALLDQLMGLQPSAVLSETWAQENQYALDAPPIPPPHMIESKS